MLFETYVTLKLNDRLKWRFTLDRSSISSHYCAKRQRFSPDDRSIKGKRRGMKCLRYQSVGRMFWMRLELPQVPSCKPADPILVQRPCCGTKSVPWNRASAWDSSSKIHEVALLMSSSPLEFTGKQKTTSQNVKTKWRLLPPCYCCWLWS